VKAASFVSKSLPCVSKATSPLALAVKAHQTVAVGPKQLVPGSSAATVAYIVL